MAIPSSCSPPSDATVRIRWRNVIPELRADIIVSGLPARDEPLSQPLLLQLQPKLIIIVDSETPATRRASSKLRERLASQNIPVFYCQDTGALKLSLRRDGWHFAKCGRRGHQRPIDRGL